MNVIKNNNELKALKSGINFKNYFSKNKYFFNELYKNKRVPKEEIVSIVNQILDYEGATEQDEKIKRIAAEFVKDHHELFESQNRVSEAAPKGVENNDENVSQNRVENASQNVSEKLEEIKQEVELIEEIKEEHPNYKHIEEFNSRIEKLKEDINKKFEDMIDSHLELKRSIDEKRNINDSDAKARIENIEGKIEMLYGQQIKPKSQQSNSKSDIMNRFINFKLSN